MVDRKEGSSSNNVVIPHRLVKRFGYAALTGIGVMLAAVAFTSACQAQSAPQPATCNETGGRVVSDTIPSQTYGSPVAVSVYLPRCYATLAGNLPVVYLLHGANADQTQWTDVNLQVSADSVISRTKTPFVVVMPGGVYLVQIDYGDFVLNDLMPAIARQYKVSTCSEGQVIGGISLGGYYALKIAFQHPAMFAAVGGHSPVVAGTGADDPLDLARTVSSLDHLRVWLDIGDADPLRTGAADLATALQARSVPVTFAVNPGDHNRIFWRAHSEEYLGFYASAIAQACHTSFADDPQWWRFTIPPFWALELTPHRRPGF